MSKIAKCSQCGWEAGHSPDCSHIIRDPMRDMRTQFSDRELSRPFSKLVEDHTGKKTTEQVTSREVGRMTKRSFIRYSALVGIGGAIGFLLRKEIFRSPTVGAVSPGGSSLKNWNLMGGSMIAPPTYMLYGDGSNYFLRDGGDGSNSFKQPGAPAVINDGFSAFSSSGRAGWLHAKSGDYPMGVASPAVIFGAGGFKFTGESMGGSGTGAATNNLPGTRFLMGTNNQTLFKASSAGDQLLEGFIIECITGYTNGFTGGKFLDLASSNENATLGARIDNIVAETLTASRVPNGTFSTALVLDGLTDLLLTNPLFDALGTGGGAGGTVCSTLSDIHYDTPNGTITIMHPFSFSYRMLIGKWLTAYIGGGYGTPSSIQFSGGASVSVPYNKLVIDSVYMGNTPGVFAGNLDVIDINGFAASEIILRNTPFAVHNSKNFIRLGGGTLDSLTMENCTIWNRDASSPNITDSIANLGRYRKRCFLTKISGAFGNNPWTLDANNYLIPHAMSVTAPADPAGTTSTVGVMAGLAATITPRSGGRLHIVFTGNGSNNTAGDGVTVTLRFGTGTPPVNGAAIAGNPFGVTARLTSSGAGQLLNWTLDAYSLIPGSFVIGTTYWFDVVEAAVTGGTATIRDILCNVTEMD